jgi:sugar lactone lactonase YvrE
MRLPVGTLLLCILVLVGPGAGRTNAQTTSGKHPTALTSPSMVNSVAFSPDGRTVLTAARTGRRGYGTWGAARNCGGLKHARGEWEYSES